MYSTDASLQLSFDKYKGAALNNVNVKRDIDSLIQDKGYTFIDKALLLSANELFTERRGMRPKRKKVALVMTDGSQTINRGPYTPLDQASERLNAKGVAIYALAVGYDPSPGELIQIASSENNIFLASSFDKLESQVTKITQSQCEACDETVDVYFGIPTAQELRGEFQNIKQFFSRLATLFQVEPRKTHIGVLRYSDTADMVLKLDQRYIKADVSSFIEGMKREGAGFNVRRALEAAADYAFTIFGGVRQTAPKTFVLFVARELEETKQNVQAAATKLKNMGVRLIIVSLRGKTVDPYLGTISSQPKSRYRVSASDYGELAVEIYKVAGTACTVKYGKCQAFRPPPPGECPSEEDNECHVDKDCSRDQVCCAGGCGTICETKVNNCFVTMDIALAIDTTSDISNEDIRNVKSFTSNLVHSLADSANVIRFGLMTYGETAKTLFKFKQIASESKIRAMIDQLKLSEESTRRVDAALQTMTKEIFSLEGGVRQGHPRYAIFLTAGNTSTGSEDLTKASEGLRTLGVNIIAVGINDQSDSGFLNILATESRFVFPLLSSVYLETLWPNMQKQLCNPKPGSCPVVPANRCTSEDSSVSSSALILCGTSAGHAGRSDKQNDWDCPGEQKCCFDSTACDHICRDPPLKCDGQFDLALLVESSSSVGKQGLEKVKDFANQLIDAFTISQPNTHVAVISYSATPTLQLGLGTLRGPTLDAAGVKSAVGQVNLTDGGVPSTAAAMRMALNDVFTVRGGTRESSNKSLVIISRGTFQNPSQAAAVAVQLRQKRVDVFVIPIGDSPDVTGLRKVVSKSEDKNVFMTTSYGALQPNLRALTRTICAGATKEEPCGEPVDIYFGIPTAKELGGEFQDIKQFFSRLTTHFQVDPRKTHIGVLKYSNTSDMVLKLDQRYSRAGVSSFIEGMKTEGAGFNVRRALEAAADYAFTIFGGVRQTAPKVLVLFVARELKEPKQSIQAAATKLKNMGVRLIIVSLRGKAVNPYLGIISSQPKSRYLITALNYNELAGEIYKVAGTVCKVNYGKCKALRPSSIGECPPQEDHECNLDKDCSDDQVCCTGRCGRICEKKVDNCFVTMDIALAIDTTSGISSEDMRNVKTFTSNLVHSLADSANAIRFGLMTYGETAKTLFDFKHIASESKIRATVDQLKPSNQSTRRVDKALQTMTKEIFSLEGGMRQGHPRYAIFLTAGTTSARSEDLAKASEGLRKLGVNIMAVGISSQSDSGFLNELATESRFAFPLASSRDLETMWPNIQKQLCNPKPGSCPYVSANRCTSGNSSVSSSGDIPCGTSAGHAGRSDKQNDWGCPGEQKCCLDSTACYYICRDPPLKCEGQFDLALLIESSSSVGKQGLEKVKDFANQLIDAFNISQPNTHVAVISFSATPILRLGLGTLRNPALDATAVKSAVGRVQLTNGGVSSTAAAMRMALNDVFTVRGSMRESSNKSLVIISQGKLQNPSQTAVVAVQLRQKLVDVFVIPIGDSPDVAGLRKVVSKPVDKNVFMTTSYGALQPNLRALTRTLCAGATKEEPCGEPVDIYFGIPTAKELGGEFQDIKQFFSRLATLFQVESRKTHIGVLRYSNTADMVLKLDQRYSRAGVSSFIEGMKPEGAGFNVRRALEAAADYAFTIFGGVRQTAPKVFVLLVARELEESKQNVLAAATKLKNMGVRLIIVSPRGKAVDPYLGAISSQPKSRYLVTALDYDELGVESYKVAGTACKVNYGKCKALRPSSIGECPPQEDHECNLDKDCSNEQVCCTGRCGRECEKKVDNCFVTMDIALAIDTTSDISNEDIRNVKSFTSNLVHSLADSANAIRFGLMTYGETAKTLVDFKQIASESTIRAMIEKLKPSKESTRRVDMALQTMTKEIFSLEGGMRQGHPRYAIFLTAGNSSADSKNLTKASGGLKKLGVNIIAAGINSQSDSGFLNELATESRFAFPLASSRELATLWPNIQKQMCNPKPGSCPAVLANRCTSGNSGVPSSGDIPCGTSAGHTGRSDKQNDWDCPGEQKCCLDPTACYYICRDPPLKCEGQFDLALLVESSSSVGKQGLEKVKDFAYQLIDAFTISKPNTHVAVISYSATPTLQLGLGTLRDPTLDAAGVKNAVGRVQLTDGGVSSTAAAMRMALNDVFTVRGGMRESSNKSLVIISQGKLMNPSQAAAVAVQLRQKLVDVFVIPIGDSPDVAGLRKVVSKPVDKNVFMTTSYGALQPNLRALTRTICAGAAKEQPCDNPIDIVFGIPMSRYLGSAIGNIKSTFGAILDLLKVNPLKAHIGVVPYSSEADLTLHLDSIYDKKDIANYIKALPQSRDSGYDLVKPLQIAADRAFTLFGGVRQTVPKVFVLFVTGRGSSDLKSVQDAATRLKSLGVRILIIGLTSQVDRSFAKSIASQPSSVYVTTANTYSDLVVKAPMVVDTICKDARYGKCPTSPSPPGGICPPVPSIDCSLDSECASPSHVCCFDECGSSKCERGIKNCFVPADIALAFDVSNSVSDKAFQDSKNLAMDIVRQLSSSENNIHLGILKYSSVATPETRGFRKYHSEDELQDILNKMEKGRDHIKRVDLAFRTAYREFFSAKGGRRFGHPKYLIFFDPTISIAGNETLSSASADLRRAKVNIATYTGNKTFASIFGDGNTLFCNSNVSKTFLLYF